MKHTDWTFLLALIIVSTLLFIGDGTQKPKEISSDKVVDVLNSRYGQIPYTIKASEYSAYNPGWDSLQARRFDFDPDDIHEARRRIQAYADSLGIEVIFYNQK